jgi:N-acetylmuramoyl-L-alanine amidase
MPLNRRDLLKGAAVATAGSLTILAGVETASAATHPTLQVGARGSHVVALQRRLSSLGYWLGAADGEFGDLTRQAVIAVQKVAGLSRDGVCGNLTWAKVNAGTRPRARFRSGHVVEIDKKTQTLLVADSGVVKQIYNTSTGSGQKYLQAKVWHVALTPSGNFRVFRRVNGWREAALGTLYRPQYFNNGIAVHGLASVPAYPASHGCARVSLPAMDNLWRAGGMNVGTAVHVY